MATNRNIQMNYYNGTDYDVLYPQTTMAQVSGLNSTISSMQNNISNFQNQLNKKLNLSGGTMTGNLILNRDPTSNLMAATKQYVDNLVEDINTGTNGPKLMSSGSSGTATGSSYLQIQMYNNTTFVFGFAQIGTEMLILGDGVFVDFAINRNGGIYFNNRSNTISSYVSYIRIYSSFLQNGTEYNVFYLCAEQ